MARQQTAQLEILFKAVDTDGDGHISEADLRTFMRDRVGFDIDDEQIKALLKELLASSTATKEPAAAGRANFSAFLAFFMKQLAKPLPDMLEEIFHLVDTNGDGRISAAELVAFADRIKVKIGIDNAAYLLSKGVTSGSAERAAQGQSTEVDFKQFCNLVQRSLPSGDKGK